MVWHFNVPALLDKKINLDSFEYITQLNYIFSSSSIRFFLERLGNRNLDVAHKSYSFSA